MSLPLVAIVGRPNVGKSTLFNRLVRRRRAIVTDEPGVTRDRQYGTVSDVPQPFRVVDTGGIGLGELAPFAREIETQADRALDEAAVVLLVVDGRQGPTPVDRELVERLRRRGLQPLLVVNKVDGEAVALGLGEFHGFGLGEPLALSAEHGLGVEELLEVVAEHLRSDTAPETLPAAPDEALAVAIVGRPNVGKSSLLNQLVGEERVMVSEVPGTTRDAIDTLVTVENRRYRLIDTAGIRRAGRVRRGVERLSVLRARTNIDRADAVVLVLDATEEFAAQDAHIAGFVGDAFKPMVVALNKWDLVEGREEAVKRWQRTIADRMPFAKQVPVVFVSAVTGQRVSRLMQEAEQVHRSAGIRVPTVELNRWLGSLREADPEAPRTAFRVFYATQTGIEPPHFLLFCNDPGRAHFSLRRQFENGIRARFGFGASPLRLEFRARRRAGR